MEQQCSDKARAYFLEQYKQNFGSYMLKDYNQGRHYLIRGTVNIWFVFKKEHFKSFRYQFPEFIDKNPYYKDSEGDSINKRMLAMAVNFGCKYIVFAQKKDEYYCADPRKLLMFCIDNNLERVQDKTNRFKARGGSTEYQNEDTYSFPLKYLRVWKFNEELKDE